MKTLEDGWMDIMGFMGLNGNSLLCVAGSVCMDICVNGALIVKFFKVH